MMRVSCVDHQVYLEQWLEVCARAGVDLYVHEKYARQLLLGCHLKPPPCLDEDLSYFHRKGVQGVQIHAAMGGWWTSATTMDVLAQLLWDRSRTADDVAAQVLERYYGRGAPSVRRVIARYERALGSWQYANSNENLNLWRSVSPTDRYPRELVVFNRRLVEEIEACTTALRRVERGLRRDGAAVPIGRLLQALTYVYFQRRAVDADIDVNTALRSLGGDRSQAVEVLREGTRMAQSARRWESAADTAGRAGYRRGLCWDLGSPAVGEKIRGVRYAW
jgi:hypothetical protein